MLSMFTLTTHFKAVPYLENGEFQNLPIIEDIVDVE